MNVKLAIVEDLSLQSFYLFVCVFDAESYSISQG